MENEKKYARTLVTTALPYANGPVHIGRAPLEHTRMERTARQASHVAIGKTSLDDHARRRSSF